MAMDISEAVSREARRFLDQFFKDRAINSEFYGWVPEEKFGFRMVDTPGLKSDFLGMAQIIVAVNKK